ncbi:MAG: FAD-dependent monooxygenase [Gemmatimonadetes bacterium]|nr:FAD-dependent monooxygenase [Gemmatimonadota bacterium]
MKTGHVPSVTIIGAGPAGAATAAYLGRRGWEVRVFEGRRDLRAEAGDDGRRSINLGLSLRGLLTLRDLGVEARVLAGAVRARGRVIHPLRGEPRFQPYGQTEDECLWSISRRDLNAALIDRAAEHENVRFVFGHQFTALEKESGTATFRDLETGESVRVEADFVVGADGAFSAVRERMQRGERADFAQEYLPWGYKEMRLPGDGGRSRIYLEALHVWPRGDCVVVSHPNRDGSHTCTLFLPHEGERRSFAALQGDGAVEAFFRETFPDLAALVPELAEQWRHHPEASLVATRTRPWHWKDRVVLVGDGCHAVYPFYGQGMNAALEDCRTLDQCLERSPGNRAAAFAEYQRVRKENTDALHTLVCRNFVELRQTSASPVFVWQKKVDFVLHRLFPRHWLPPYTMVVHTTMPYAEALRRADRQARIRRRLGIDLLIWMVLPFAALARRARRPDGPAADPAGAAVATFSAGAAGLALDPGHGGDHAHV